MPVPGKIPVQGAKPASTTQTIKAWGEQLASKAMEEAKKRLKVDEHDPDAVEVDPLADVMGDPMAEQDRHAFSGNRREDRDPVATAFFTDELEEDKERKKRERRKVQQRTNPTSKVGPATKPAKYNVNRLGPDWQNQMGMNSASIQPDISDNAQAAMQAMKRMGQVHTKLHDPDPSARQFPSQQQTPTYPVSVDDEQGDLFLKRAGTHFSNSTKLPSQDFSLALNELRDAGLFKSGDMRPDDEKALWDEHDLYKASSVPTRYTSEVARHTSPPNMDGVVRRLATIPGLKSPHALAWSMYDRQKHSEGRAMHGIERLNPSLDVYQRNLKILDYVASGNHRSDADVIHRLREDALWSLERSIPDTNDIIHKAWRHVITATAADALGTVSRSSGGFGVVRHACSVGDDGRTKKREHLPVPYADETRKEKQGPNDSPCYDDGEMSYEEDEIRGEMSGKGKQIPLQKSSADEWLERLNALDRKTQYSLDPNDSWDETDTLIHNTFTENPGIHHDSVSEELGLDPEDMAHRLRRMNSIDLARQTGNGGWEAMPPEDDHQETSGSVHWQDFLNDYQQYGRHDDSPDIVEDSHPGKTNDAVKKAAQDKFGKKNRHAEDAGELRESASEGLAQSNFKKPGPAKKASKDIEKQTGGAVDKRQALSDIKKDAKMRRSEYTNDDVWLDKLAEVDQNIERFAEGPQADERRKKFLKKNVSKSEEGDKNVDKLSGQKLARAATMSGALQTGRPPSTVRKGVEKRFPKE